MGRQGPVAVRTGQGAAGFSHDLLEHHGWADGVSKVGALVEDAWRTRTPVLVAGPASWLDDVRGTGLSDPDRRDAQVHLVSLEGPLRNPALLAQELVDFVDAFGDGVTPVGITDTLCGRTVDDQLIECKLHDALLDELFGPQRPFTLTCPIDVDAIPAEVVARARRLHAGETVAVAEELRELPLAEPTGVVAVRSFDSASSRDTRRWVRDQGSEFGLRVTAVDSLEIVAGELIANSLVHGGGSGTIRLWTGPDALVCEVRDQGSFDLPFVERRPDPLQLGGRGLWIVNRISQLVQVRNTARGAIVRAHLARDVAAERPGRPERRGPGPG